ncbi:EthD family reductase [Amycolatopsis orientalis]|uniref:EthD family reductase n=1 Tax=Amycolatopsis orientalis TaxID=31958 RepID=UPI0003A66C2F|nr:EthD family reductase [Amycolatopsis orientalis]
MHKLLVLYPPPVDPAAFSAHYENQHLPLVRQLPGLLGWRYSLRVHAEPESPYFAVFEAEFADADAYAAAMASPQGVAVREDVPNYATGGALVLDYPVAEA